MIKGRFYFKRTVSGNLIGEFSNDTSLGNSTESADRVGIDHGNFIGYYTTTWQENNTPILSQLKISLKGGAVNLFTLEWVVNGKIKFKGEGLVVDDLLIGNYHG